MTEEDKSLIEKQDIVNPEKMQERFKELEPLCETKEQFLDVGLKVALLEMILSQVNEIFTSSLYPTSAKALIDSSAKAISEIQSSIVDEYIKTSLDKQVLAPIPDVNDIAYWVEEVHLDIAKQLYTEGFINTVFQPALETITESVIEFAKEESAAVEADQKIGE